MPKTAARSSPALKGISNSSYAAIGGLRYVEKFIKSTKKYTKCVAGGQYKMQKRVKSPLTASREPQEAEKIEGNRAAYTPEEQTVAIRARQKEGTTRSHSQEPLRKTIGSDLRERSSATRIRQDRKRNSKV
jgi:hypothetical protein